MYPPKVCAALKRAGFTVHAIALRGSNVSEAFKDAGVPTLEFSSLLTAILSIPSILSYVNKCQIRIIHGHKSGDMRLTSLLVQLAPDRCLFFTDHIGVIKPKKDWYHRWAYSKLSRLFSISQITYQRNLKSLPVSKHRVVQLYSGIDLNAYKGQLHGPERNLIRAELGLPANAVLVVLPGRIAPGKGHETWVCALSQLCKYETASPWHAVVIGEAYGRDSSKGGYKERVQSLILELGLGDRVTFLGHRNDIARCLGVCEIATIPSDNEAFGFTVIESMAAGCSIIGSDAGSLPELVGKTRGALVPPNQPKAWAKSLQELINEPGLRQRLSRDARQWALQNFDIEKHAQSLAGYYSQVLSEGI